MTETLNSKKRLFFAAWPDASVLSAINDAAKVLSSHTGRKIATENLHMTLVFIGNAEADKQKCLESVAGKIKSQAIDVTLDNFGYFKKPQIVWLGSQFSPPALQSLVENLSLGFAACGYRPEHPQYIPHISLLRKAQSLIEELPKQSIAWHIDRFYLAESIAIEGGVVYQKLKTYLLN